MSINLTDEIEVKTKKGKLGAAKQIFLEGDMQTVENEIQDINSRHNTLNTKYESLSRTVQGIAVTGGANTATNVTYNNDNSRLNAENAQDAIDEVSSIVTYDVSARNDGVVFESLQALLSSSNLNTLIPTSVRHGGMNIRFIRSSDNKYVQYRYIGTSIDTANFINTDNWVSVEDEAVNAVKKLGIESSFNGKYIIKDENGNIAFVIDAQGLKARKYNICNVNGTVIGTLDASVLESLLQKQDQLVSGVNIATVNGEDLLKGGPDYIPNFENLLPIKTMTFSGKDVPMPNIGYLWFLMGLMDAWGPHSQALVGSLLNPAI